MLRWDIPLSAISDDDDKRGSSKSYSVIEELDTGKQKVAGALSKVMRM